MTARPCHGRPAPRARRAAAGRPRHRGRPAARCGRRDARPRRGRLRDVRRRCRPPRDNAVFVCHALTGDAHAAGLQPGRDSPGWWDNLIGPGKPLDTDRFFVVSPNLLGGCSGTTGPSSIDPATGAPYCLDFPLLHMTTSSPSTAGCSRTSASSGCYAAVGGSLGGMQVLQWAIDDPEEVERAVVVAACAGCRRRTSRSPRWPARRS